MAIALVVRLATAQMLPGPTSRYTDDWNGTPVQLDYFALPAGPGVVFGMGEVGRHGALPPPARQGMILDRLLGRLLAEHPEIAPTFIVRLGESREALIEELDRRLLKPGADWDRAHGAPLKGQFGAVLKGVLGDVIESSPIAEAFAAHSYQLRLDGISRIEIQTVPSAGGARLPVAIDIMSLTATRASP